MFPVLFRIGNFAVSSYGVMVALAFVVGYLIAEREWKRLDLPDALLGDLAVGIPVSAMIGAKLMYVLENYPLSWVIQHPGVLFERAGLTFYGGFLLAVVTGLWLIHRHGLNYRLVGGALAPSLAIGYGIGRIGCFLVGDDYGKPSSLPWAMAFPRGAPPTVDPVTGEIFRVHPTQLYETTSMLILFAYLWWRRKQVTPERLFGEYLVLAGLERFLVEFIRNTTPSLIPGLSVAQLIALGLILWGGYELRGGSSVPSDA